MEDSSHYSSLPSYFHKEVNTWIRSQSPLRHIPLPPMYLLHSDSAQSLLNMALTSSQTVKVLNTRHEEKPQYQTMIPFCPPSTVLSSVTLLPSVRAVWIFSGLGSQTSFPHCKFLSAPKITVTFFPHSASGDCRCLWRFSTYPRFWNAEFLYFFAWDDAWSQK